MERFVNCVNKEATFCLVIVIRENLSQALKLVNKGTIFVSVLYNEAAMQPSLQISFLMLYFIEIIFYLLQKRCLECVISLEFVRVMKCNHGI